MSGWLVGIGITLAVELFLIWRISRALARGTIKVDPLFWLADTFGFDFTVSRAANPLMYWAGTLFLVVIAVAVLVLFAAVAFNNLR